MCCLTPCLQAAQLCGTRDGVILPLSCVILPPEAPGPDRRHTGFTPLAPATPRPDLMNSTGLTLGTVLLAVSGLFCLATLFFGTKGGYYDTDDYDGNGTAH